ncbi:glycoside hydrolase family 27 protein [Pontibacter virosus]|uniref:Alpha-galactosidase n=1 Tax=Pontibacter virosus TaxID=1765052 RepID=A0A2U1B503_9BACT|nr:glycoside hydrolase family 27 protein [Pontibacter virosus]PVY43766.1 alpha-galactosidase [Pontibacter virosus]
MRKLFLLFFFGLSVASASGQQQKDLAPTPPMGWMTWNFFADNIHEKDIREMADAMVALGMVEAGYNYIFIDDGWQGGRDNRNNMIPDPAKFPSGIKALADYVHSKGMKLGIYSDAAPLTCAGYTASLGFEEQDAKTFASWGIDYLKYDYCHAPKDSATAVARYTKMGEALRKSGREIVYGVCEWGQLKPWHWAAEAGGQLWRTTYDVRDKWKNLGDQENAEGIIDILDINADLHAYAGPGRWNDADMLVVGLYGKPGPSGDMGGVGMTDTEYQSQMSLWSIMASPLIATNDVRNMNEATRRILLNKEVIAVNQDPLGKQAERKINDGTWNVFVKALENGDYAVAILNRADKTQNYSIDWSALGLGGRYEVRDLWEHKTAGKGKGWKGRVQSHETKLFRLRKI